jgi:hypothetical protein
MKQNPRLRLVPPPAADHVGGSDEPPFTEDELREAAALRGALDRGADPLASALSAAYRPASLADEDLDAILARALGEGDAPATRLERDAAESLRVALERGGELADDAAILGDLRAAHRPAALAPARNEELIAGAIGIAIAAAPRAVAPISRLRRALPATMATITGVLALAAGFALLVQTRSFAPPMPSSGPRFDPVEVAPTALIRSRSTDDLFDPAEKFEIGHTSARIDRIASARSSDLRRNRFAAWGVR